MAAEKLDKLVRSFLAKTSNPNLPYDPFADLQDPTFLSFKIDFFPDGGLSIPEDAVSSGGLFRFASLDNTSNNYLFLDSAAEYLRRTGSPARQTYLEIFMNMLYRIQNEAPWYFQSISGLGDLWKIDPANNFRGKDKVLTIDCLESIDLRMTLLADLYRNMAFDMKYMKEILPMNLRTFSMDVHVLEMRRFNTTFGLIAQQLRNAKPVKINTDSIYQNGFNDGSTTTNSITPSYTTQPTPGTNNDPLSIATLSSAFEAISVQTFRLRNCEFDFFSEAPPYLDTVSVKDTTETAFRFKIKVGKIEKISSYPFYNYVISENAKNTIINPSEITNVNTTGTSRGQIHLENTNLQLEEKPLAGFSTIDQSTSYFSDIRESIYPTNVSNSGDTSKADGLAAYAQNRAEQSLSLTQMRAKQSRILTNTIAYLEGVAVVDLKLNNVYNNSLLTQAAQILNGFISSTPEDPNTLKNIYADVITSVAGEISPVNSLDTTTPSVSVLDSTDSILETPVSVNTTISPKNDLEPALPVNTTISPKNDLDAPTPINTTISPLNNLDPGLPLNNVISPLNDLEPGPPPNTTISPKNDLEPGPPPNTTISPKNDLEPGPPPNDTISPTNDLVSGPPPNTVISPLNDIVPGPPPNMIISPPNVLVAGPLPNTTISPTNDLVVGSPVNNTISPSNDLEAPPTINSIISPINDLDSSSVIDGKISPKNIYE